MGKIRETVSGLVSRLLDLLLRVYQAAVRPWLGSRCRFHPSCSDYARESIRVFGPWRGGAKAAGRLLRCHPFHPGGYDPPVPEK